MRFLIVEDNEKLARLLEAALTEQGYQVDKAFDGHAGERRALQGDYDLIVLDLMLPDHDGLTICRNLRRREVTTPILMLTALGETEERVAGLDAGADDYLPKPFDMDELLARVRALLRRAQADEGGVLRFEDIEMDLLRRSVTRDGQPIGLTSKEFALLEHFLRNPNRVLARSHLGQRVWDMNFEQESNVIEVSVSRLRNKIDKPFDKQLIHTVIGAGYILSADRPAL